jgi:uncharacterized repeat protein (TIGR01451 family)
MHLDKKGGPMMTKKWMNCLAVSLILVVVALSSLAVAGTTQDCSTLTIKSIWPAIIELDPYTLLVKDRNSFWEINKSTASIYGDYAWGISGLPTKNGPDIYFLHSIENFTGNTNIYRLNMDTGKSTQYIPLNVRAYGLAQKGNQFYIAYYDSVEKKNVVQRVGGEKTFLPEIIGAIDYVSDPSGDYLLAITAKLGSHNVFKIPLGADGKLDGTYTNSLAVKIQVDLSSPLYSYAYTGITHARIPVDDGEREVIYVSKDSGNYEPWDVVAVVDFATGQVLNTMIATDSGITINPPIKWPNGITSDYLSWANPQGLQYIEDVDEDGKPLGHGRLFMVTRYYWNKGPVCLYLPDIDIEKYVSVDNKATWDDADSPTGPSVTAGNPVYFKFIVTNTGNVALTNIAIDDDVFALDGCEIPTSLNPSAYFECFVGPVTAVQGQHVNVATVTGQYDSLPAVSDDDSAHYYGQPGKPGIHIEKSGPVYAYSGDPITYTYTVTNTGDVPLANVVVTDDRCAQPTYVSGDGNGNNLLDLTEIWSFSCTCSPSFTFPDSLVNTATVTGEYGSQKVKDQDDYTLYPFVLRKNIFLYWDSPARTIPYPLEDSTLFNVLMKKDGKNLDSFTISQISTKEIWLSDGTYEFCEFDIPTGYLPGYSCISYTTGEGYPDWGFPNVITFDLAIDKAGPEEACPGETVTYTYKVTNAGPASVVPSVLDDKCGTPTRTGGDVNTNGYIDTGEIWTYTCNYQIPTDAGSPLVRTIVDTLVNTVVVSDANAPDSGGWILGGDRNTVNNTDTWSLSVKPCTLTGEICGTKFADVNGNGRRDEVEGVISGVGITLFSGNSTLLDFVDIGDAGSANTEATHDLQGWGPIEPDAHGGNWGGIASDPDSSDKKARVAWFEPAEGLDQRWARVKLDAAASPENLLNLRVLDGLGDDSFVVQVNGHILYAYMGKNNPASGGSNLFGDPSGQTESWHVHQIYVPYSGELDIAIIPTAAAWSGFVTYGQLAVDRAELYALTQVELGENPRLTDGEGKYCFSQLSPSEYYVAETSLLEGRIATTPTVRGPITPSSQGNDFGNTQISASIDVEKYVSVDNQAPWLDADEAPGPDASVGADVYFKFVVTNTGSFPLTSITLVDDHFDLSTCVLEDPLQPSDSFECIIGIIEPIAAELGQHTNTATATGQYGQVTYTDYDDANYFGQKGQAGTTLTATKTATGQMTRTFGWTIDKSVNREILNLFRGDSAASEYTVTVTKDGGTDAASVEGEVCVTNGGERPTENLKIVDTVQYKTGSGQFQDYVSVSVNPSAKPVLEPGESYCYPYTVAFAPVPDAQYRNAAKVTITNHSGHFSEEFGPEPKAPFSLPVEPILVNNSIHVDDTNAGQSWVFNASGSQAYSKNFTCDADSGVHKNTATIQETGQSDNASVTVNCYSLNVTKDASTSFKRTYKWTIDKTGDQTDLTLDAGETATVNYNVVLNATFTDGDWAAAGNISISNPAPMAATINGVTDLLSGDIAATVNCGVSFPYSLSAGGKLQCTYVANLPDKSGRTNTATAVLQNIPSGTTGFSGSAGVDFATASMNEIDKTITVTDTLHGDLGSVTYGVDTLPKTFSYSQLIGPYSSSGDYAVANTASFVTNNTATAGNDSWTVKVHVGPLFGVGDFCTYTQGGWGSRPSGNNPGSILANNFDDVYLQGYVLVGYTGTGGKSIRFTTAPFVDRYLPASGTPNKLTITYPNPTTTASGVFGGQVLALQLNVDFNAAGIIDGADGSIGGLRLCNTGTSLDGKTVNEILAAANRALGGGSLPTGYTYSTLNDLVTHLNEAFDNCNVSTWALEHLCR